MAYQRIKPWGEERADLRMGVLAALTANLHRGKGQKPYTAKDFMPKFSNVQRGRELKQKLKSIFGGKV